MWKQLPVLWSCPLPHCQIHNAPEYCVLCRKKEKLLMTQTHTAGRPTGQWTYIPDWLPRRFPAYGCIHTGHKKECPLVSHRHTLPFVQGTVLSLFHLHTTAKTLFASDISFPHWPVGSYGWRDSAASKDHDRHRTASSVFHFLFG